MNTASEVVKKIYKKSYGKYWGILEKVLKSFEEVY